MLAQTAIMPVLNLLLTLSTIAFHVTVEALHLKLMGMKIYAHHCGGDVTEETQKFYYPYLELVCLEVVLNRMSLFRLPQLRERF